MGILRLDLLLEYETGKGIQELMEMLLGYGEEEAKTLNARINYSLQKLSRMEEP
ncbi:hypothetical protein C808_02869 [Lachnospiraceae bacterium M18-1]|nr:hypothetical protein C808_02869 [Lachnospiraceae bacterium M18-1]